MADRTIPKQQGFKIWNSETSEFLGRSGKRWLQILVFYLIYYCCLGAFFSATIYVFYQTVEDDSPKLQAADSLLKGNPGLGFKPMPDIETTLVHVTADTVEKNSDSIKRQLEEYKLQQGVALEDTVDCADGVSPSYSVKGAVLDGGE